MTTSFAQIQQHNDSAVPEAKKAYMETWLSLTQKKLEKELQARLKDTTSPINRITITSEVERTLFCVKKARSYFKEQYKDWPFVGVGQNIFGRCIIDLRTYAPTEK